MSVDAAAEEQFGPYLVYERLGVGGMATVHRAVERNEVGIERTVALKRLLPHLAEDASFIKSFVREAKLASLLSHVNIVQIYELGRVGTEYFISMEYIDGRDIRRLLRHARRVTGPPPIFVALGLIIQLCDALDYAHNKVDEDGRPLGLVHRDISPSNLIITSQGHLKIIDFGIAKAQSSQLRTQTGRIKGKLAYMAPEAVSGSRELDARSDIWAAGVILHELCTARPLFASRNEYQTLMKVQKGDILPPSTFNQACPPELDAIVFKALARDADERFSSAAEMREELVALKRRYALQTGYRDIASWVEWAFGLEAPGGFSGDTSGVISISHTKTPLPTRTTEEDEAVEVVWGSGNVESEDGPVVLDDVPDVSEKHQRPRTDTNDERYAADDIPTPQPSHGALPAMHGQKATVPQTPIASDPRPKRPTNVSAAVLPPVVAARRPASGLVPVVRNRPPTAPPLHVDAPQIGDRMAAQRARDTNAPITVPDGRALSRAETTQSSAGSGLDDELPTVAVVDGDAASSLAGLDMDTNTAKPVPRAPLSEEELFGNDAADVLRNVAEQVEAMSTHSAMPNFGLAEVEPTTQPEIKPIQGVPAVPVVRFSKGQSIPPPISDAPSRPQPITGIPATKPGFAPIPMASPSRTQPRPSVSPVGFVTPSAPSPAAHPPVIVAPKKRTWIFVVVGLVLAVATAAIVAVTLGGGRDETAAPATPPPAATPPAPIPGKLTGTVKFVLEPADAEISIEGKVAHAGSPWSAELPAGIHQVEIHKQGYKAWVTALELSANETSTLRVVLEPITSAAVVEDATLTIATTPPGLDVYIDGELFEDKTPIKTTLKAGAHKISVKQNGTEVWQQTLNAESASDYEFNPSFTDDKKRERAQRVRPAPAPAPAPPAPSPSAGSGSDAGSAEAAGSGSAAPARTSGSGDTLMSPEL